MRSSLLRLQKQQPAIIKIIMFIPAAIMKRNATKKTMRQGMQTESYWGTVQTTVKSITIRMITMTARMTSEMRLLQKKPYLQMLVTGCIPVRIIIKVKFSMYVTSEPNMLADARTHFAHNDAIHLQTAAREVQTHYRPVNRLQESLAIDKYSLQGVRKRMRLKRVKRSEILDCLSFMSRSDSETGCRNC